MLSNGKSAYLGRNHTKTYTPKRFMVLTRRVLGYMSAPSVRWHLHIHLPDAYPNRIRYSPVVTEEALKTLCVMENRQNRPNRPIYRDMKPPRAGIWAYILGNGAPGCAT